MEFHPKLAIDLDVFRDRIDPSPRPPRHIVVGVRSLGREAKLEELPRRAARADAARGRNRRRGLSGNGVRPPELPRRRREGRHRRDARALLQGRPASLEVWRLTLGCDHERNWSFSVPSLRDAAERCSRRRAEACPRDTGDATRPRLVFPHGAVGRLARGKPGKGVPTRPSTCGCRPLAGGGVRSSSRRR